LFFLQPAYDGTPENAPSASETVIRPRLRPAAIWLSLNTAPLNVPVMVPRAPAALTWTVPWRASISTPEGSWRTSLRGTNVRPVNTRTSPLIGDKLTLLPRAGSPGARSFAVTKV